MLGIRVGHCPPENGENVMVLQPCIYKHIYVYSQILILQLYTSSCLNQRLTVTLHKNLHAGECRKTVGNDMETGLIQGLHSGMFMLRSIRAYNASTRNLVP